MDGLDESLPVTPWRRALLKRMMKRMRRVIAECKQAIIDYESWSDMPHNREHAHTIDMEDFRVAQADMEKRLEQAERIWNRGW